MLQVHPTHPPTYTFTVTRLQKYSSFAINMFTTLHLANVSLIPAATGSVDASETYLLMTREIYQTAVTEPLLVILPFVAHVGSGVALRLLRRRQNVKRYGAIPGDRSRFSPWPGISYISAAGYALTVFYGVHVYVNRLLPLAVEGDRSNIGLAYVAHGFARHPLVARVAYVGLIATAAGHMIWGNAKWLGLAPSTRGWLQPRKGITGEEAVLVDRKTRRQRRRRWLAVHGAAVGFAALWAVGGLGVVARAGASGGLGVLWWDGVSGGWVWSLYDDVLARNGLYA